MKRMLKICVGAIFVAVCQLSFPQGTSIYSDSLVKDTATLKSLKIKLQALQQTSNKPGLKESALLYKGIGNDFQRINQYDSAIAYYLKGLDLVQDNKLPEIYSSLIYNLGLVYMRTGNYEKALEHALLALKTDKKIGKVNSIAASLNLVALIHQNWGVFDKSLEYRLESIRISEKAGNNIEVANGYYNLANLYGKMGKHGLEVEYFKQANLKYELMLQQNEDDYTVQHAYSESIYSLSTSLLAQGNIEEANQYLEQSLQIKFRIADKTGIGNVYVQKGNIQVMNRNYSIAIQLYFQALGYKQSANDPKGAALAYHLIGNTNYLASNLKRAEIFLQKSNEIANRVHAKEISKENYRVLSKLYKQTDRFEEALNCHQLFKNYADSILNEGTAKTVEELNIRYETDKKEQQNKILELTVKKQRSTGFYLIGTIVLVLVILIILFVQYRSKQKTNKVISNKNIRLELQNDKIAEQKKVIEDKNRDLTDSIVYAQRIQESLLADTKILQNTLPESFILLKPKDIVSGDFYWFARKDNRFIFSAIDCTGHGVPGAFMSMLGNSYLNQIVFNKGITSSNEILEELNIEIQKALKQSETDNQDGMDMALCSIDLKGKCLEFTGAKNPLVYILNGELVKIKGDKKPIGRSGYTDEPFSKHEIAVHEPTCFYMFSDGYADQFGGPENRKFMIKRLNKLLLEIHKKPMAEQKIILEQTIEAWMKDKSQIDDMLVVGFRL